MSLVDPSMEDLPDNVMAEILSRLPVKTIIHCKSVSKKWQNIVSSDSYFADLQHSRSPAGFMVRRRFIKQGVWKWVEVEDELDHHHLYRDPVMSFDLSFVAPLEHSRIDSLGSVNGLICLREINFDTSKNYICNPITREFMVLPPGQEYCLEGFPNMLYCFGVGSLTRECKLTRILQMEIMTDSTSAFQVCESEAEVYTLGTGQWRSLGHVPYSFINICGQFFNGHGHWIIRDQDSSEKICVFDFDKETFELFPSPPSEAIKGHPSLGVLKGCLCRYDEYNSNLTVWMMKEYGIENSWRKELVIRFGFAPDLGMLCYVRECVVEGFKDGTFLMKSNYNNLYVYCPRRKMIVDADVCDGCVNGFAYRPSFHRLQTLLNSDNERVHAF